MASVFNTTPPDRKALATPVVRIAELTNRSGAVDVAAIPNTSDAVAGTATTASLVDDYTPSKLTGSGILQTFPHRSSQTSLSTDARVEIFKKDLEDQYKLQADQRLATLIAQHPNGDVAPEETEKYRTQEAIARTRFFVYKDGEVTKLIQKLAAPLRDPFSSSPTTPSRRNGSSGNRFSKPQQVPPPRPHRNISSNPSTSYGSMSSQESHDSRITTSSNMDGSSSVNNDGASVTNHVSVDQAVACFEQVYKKIDALTDEQARVGKEVADLKYALTSLFGSSGFSDHASRIGRLEEKVAILQNSQALESDNALVANLARDLRQLRFEVHNLVGPGGDVLSRKAFTAETELTKMTFNSKVNLIEKYLGIDITTTGPKPHDVLEALHRRLWILETYLPRDDVACKLNAQYKPLNEFMKTTMGRGNSMVSYSATPGFSGGALSDTSSTYGGAMPNDYGAGYNHLQGSTYGQLVSDAPSVPTHHQSHGGQNGFPSQIRFDQNDVRHGSNTANNTNANPFSNLGNLLTDQAAHGFPRSRFKDNTEFLRSTTVPEFFPAQSTSGFGAMKSPLVGDVSDSTPTPRASQFNITSPASTPGPRTHVRRERSSTTTILTAGSSTAKPEGRPVGRSNAAARLTSPPADGPSHASRGSGLSGSATVDSASGAVRTREGSSASMTNSTATEAKTSREAYTAWLNQKPGDFMGKSLAGLGQKKDSDV